MSNDPKPNGVPRRPDLEELSISELTQQATEGGIWVRGKLGGYQFDAIVTPEHAAEPGYEIGKSRLAKLWIERVVDGQCVAHFDCGWVVGPTLPIVQAIVDYLAAKLARLVGPR